MCVSTIRRIGVRRLLLRMNKTLTAKSDQDSNQQVGQNDGYQRDQEWGELVTPFTPHLAKQLGAGQFESCHQQNRCQGCERNHVEVGGQQVPRK